MKHNPIRMCIFCKNRLPKSEMKRFVVLGKQIVEDKRQNLEGRGAYCCLNKRCLNKLVNDKKGLLNRALRKKDLK